MPKTLGTESKTVTTERHCTSFSVGLPIAGAPYLDVSMATVERDADGDLTPRDAAQHRFSAGEMRAAVDAHASLPDFDTLYLALSDVMHSLVDAAEAPAE